MDSQEKGEQTNFFGDLKNDSEQKTSNDDSGVFGTDDSSSEQSIELFTTPSGNPNDVLIDTTKNITLKDLIGLKQKEIPHQWSRKYKFKFVETENEFKELKAYSMWKNVYGSIPIEDWGKYFWWCVKDIRKNAAVLIIAFNIIENKQVVLHTPYCHIKNDQPQLLMSFAYSIFFQTLELSIIKKFTMSGDRDIKDPQTRRDEFLSKEFRFHQGYTKARFLFPHVKERIQKFMHKYPISTKEIATYFEEYTLKGMKVIPDILDNEMGNSNKPTSIIWRIATVETRARYKTIEMSIIPHCDGSLLLFDYFSSMDYVIEDGLLEMLIDIALKTINECGIGGDHHFVNVGCIKDIDAPFGGRWKFFKHLFNFSDDIGFAISNKYGVKCQNGITNFDSHRKFPKNYERKHFPCYRYMAGFNIDHFRLVQEYLKLNRIDERCKAPYELYIYDNKCEAHYKLMRDYMKNIDEESILPSDGVLQFEDDGLYYHYGKLSINYVKTCIRNDTTITLFALDKRKGEIVSTATFQYFNPKTLDELQVYDHSKPNLLEISSLYTLKGHRAKNLSTALIHVMLHVSGTGHPFNHTWVVAESITPITTKILTKYFGFEYLIKDVSKNTKPFGVPGIDANFIPTKNVDDWFFINPPLVIALELAFFGDTQAYTWNLGLLPGHSKKYIHRKQENWKRMRDCGFKFLQK